MDKQTEKYLKNLIIESSSESDVDEMADWKKMAGITKKFEKINDDSNNLVGWNVQGTPILFTCGSDIEEFIQSHPELIAGLKEKFGENLKWEQGNLPGCQPRRKLDVRNFPDVEGGDSDTIDTSYVHSGEQMSATEKIKRKLFAIVDKEFTNNEFSNVLSLRSIPTLEAKDRTNLNMYAEFNNSRIKYETHNYNSYESVQDFLKAVVARIKGVETPEMKTYYLARQYNKKYSHWQEDKKNLTTYKGKTPIYKLDKYGLEEKNLDVSVRMDFEVDGELQGGSYIWNVRIKTSLGKKLKEESGIKGGLLDDKIIQSTKSVQLGPDKEFDDNSTIMDDISIVSALMEAISELKEKIASINPKSNLKQANVKQYQIKESQKEKLIKRVVSQLK